VTVTFRDLPGLGRTLRSLADSFSGHPDDIEVIVVDGGTPGLEKALEGAALRPAVAISEADEGTYDAMNKGLARATAPTVWFLNGGDECTITDWPALRRLLNRDRVIFGAYWLVLGSRRMLRQPRSARYMWHGLPTSHQAILYPTRLAAEARYDLRYRVAGDYDFTARVLAQPVDVVLTDQPLSAFYSGGSSHQHSIEVAREAAVVKKRVLGVPLPLRVFSRIRQRVTSTARELLSR
jgi:putative colanic acid biosynthesis glycosyltransferase